uniref:Uncharacterized protein n=1 Tax=Oryza brachyantha TaxID=4533 RepID=J3LGN8_ORYBR
MDWTGALNFWESLIFLRIIPSVYIVSCYIYFGCLKFILISLHLFRSEMRRQNCPNFFLWRTHTWSSKFSDRFVFMSLSLICSYLQFRMIDLLIWRKLFNWV